MRLVKLTLSGFKSFADRTEFTFDEAVIGVVGPNGCGKSNIVDSIKWVLGERSSKSLRGKEMIDVIFAGSAGRKPAGMAAVTLTFENPVVNASAAMVELQYGDHPDEDGESGQLATGNGQLAGLGTEDSAPSTDGANVTRPAESDTQSSVLSPQSLVSGPRRRALPVDSDIVEVERRLFRDGTSQYLINGKRARLRDIRDLFLDTGIGADAYSIIEQGKVDAMLLASPQERRIIFEEAAGVAKYKQRRIEAQRKLERAQANLALTRQQLESTERRLRIVKGQAAKARRFRELEADLRALRMAVAFEQYDDVRRRLDGLTSRLADLEGDRTAAIDAVTALERRKQEADVQRHELSTRHRAAEEQRLAAEHARDSAVQRRAMTERALADARAQAEADTARLSALEARITELQEKVRSQAEAVAAVAEQLTEADRQVEAAAGARAEAQSLAAEADAALAQKRAALAAIERERATLGAAIEADQRRADGLRDEVGRLADRISAIDAGRARVAAGRDLAEGALTERRRRLEGLERRLADLARKGESLDAGRRGLAGRVQELEQRHLRLDSRRQTLTEMIETRAGLADAVRDVLARRDAGHGFTGVIAPLAELISTDAAYAPLVEAALGPVLQALIVESPEAMPREDELATLSGRVTFIPLPASARGIPANGTPPDGRTVPTLRTFVTARTGSDDSRSPAIESLLAALLSGTRIAESIDEASLLALSAPGIRFVTRSGAVREADGRIVAGPPGASDSAGVLQRRTELSQLQAELQTLDGALGAERVALAGVDSEVAALSTEQAAVLAQTATEQRAIAADQVRLEQLHAECDRLDRERTELHDQMEDHAMRSAWLDGDLAQRRERLAAMARLRQEEAAAAEVLEQTAGEARTRSDAQAERLTAAKIEAGRLAEQVAGARREHRRLAGDAEHAEGQRRDAGSLVAQSVARVIEHEQSLAACATQIQRCEADARQFADMAAALAETVRHADEQARELGERVGAARQRAQAVERDWHALEVSRREVEVKREGLEERASEELRLDLAFEYADYREMMSDESVVRVDLAKAGADAETLRAEIARLGSVNLDAIEEETQLAQRNENLIRQVADIDDAATKLADLIERLNAASRERFGEVFGRIQEHFAGPTGMFRKLFGGGKAEVRLMPLVKETETAQGVQRVETDEIDLLESGIEVIAKPPGKEPRSISQLSGGEKTLTAVALLLAIFQSKPSCFCILDEVDAALDDANVGRFCGVVRQFTAHSHFIVITHNKKTMQAADRLYGVTMQEKGVSTRVSVKFEQVGNNGEVRHATAVGRHNGAATETPTDHANGEFEAKPTPPRRRLPFPDPASRATDN